jgi:hypothetical protein
MNGFGRLASAAALLAVVAVVATIVFSRPQASPTGQGTPSSSPMASASAPATSAASGTPAPTCCPPVPTASPRVAGTTILLEGMALQPGTTYAPLAFTPAFTVKGAAVPGATDPGNADWTLISERSDWAWFAAAPGLSPYDPLPVAYLFIPGAVLPNQDPRATSQPAPTDLIAWLRSRSDMSVGPSKPITIGGVTGVYADGSMTSYASYDVYNWNIIMCPSSAPGCSDANHAIGTGLHRPFRFIVLKVHGQTVVIYLDTAGPTADFSVFDSFVNNLTWVTTP